MNYFDDDDDLFGEQLIRKNDKIGRNDPCFCGSGIKYKQCCLTKEPLSTQYITASEKNFLQKKEEVQSFSPKEISELSSAELQSLDLKKMTIKQLKVAINATSHNNLLLSFTFLSEMRKFYIDTNGKLSMGERVIKLPQRKITLPKGDDLYDYWLMDFVYSAESENRLDFIPKVIELFFDTKSDDHKKAEFLYHLYKKDVPQILNYVEKTCIRGIADEEEFINLYYSIKDHYPGIAVMLFRALIAAFPDRSFDIEMMNEYIHEIYSQFDIETEDDPAMYTFDKIHELENEETENDIEMEELQAIRKELRQTLAESSNQQRQIKQLEKKQQIMQPSKSITGEDEDQIQKSKNKIKQLKEIINSKQQAIRTLKESIQEKNNEPEKINNSDEFEKTIDSTNFTAPKVFYPSFPDKFKKSVESLDITIGKQAIKAFTGFITNDPKIMKQTKKLANGDHYYSIRIGIHYRLILKYVPNSEPIPEYIIHRKDLETIVKKLK